MRRKLEQLRASKLELARIEEKLKKMHPEYVIDFAKDYSTGFPIPVKIEGYNTFEVDRLTLIYQQKANALYGSICDAEEFIRGVQCAEDRLILERIYIDGKKHWEVAEELNLSRETITKRIKKLFST